MKLGLVTAKGAKASKDVEVSQTDIRRALQ